MYLTAAEVKLKYPLGLAPSGAFSYLEKREDPTANLREVLTVGSIHSLAEGIQRPLRLQEPICTFRPLSDGS